MSLNNYEKHRLAGWDSTVSSSDYLGPFVSLSGAFHPLLEMEDVPNSLVSGEVKREAT